MAQLEVINRGQALEDIDEGVVEDMETVNESKFLKFYFTLNLLLMKKFYLGLDLIAEVKAINLVKKEENVEELIPPKIVIDGVENEDEKDMSNDDDNARNDDSDLEYQESYNGDDESDSIGEFDEEEESFESALEVERISNKTYVITRDGNSASKATFVLNRDSDAYPSDEEDNSKASWDWDWNADDDDEEEEEELKFDEDEDEDENERQKREMDFQYVKRKWEMTLPSV